MNKNKVLLITTKAITQNIFFKKFINNNPFDLTLGCSDIKNLNFNKKKIQFNFYSKFWFLLNPFRFLNTLIDIRKKIIKDKFNIIIINNPLASLYIRISLLFSNQKLIYFVHGYRFHNSEKNYKYFIFYFIEKFLSYATNYYININKEDYLITKKKFNINHKKILTLPSVGIDLKKINIFKKKNKINKIFKIGVIAAYRDNKGYKDLIKISEILLANNCNAKIECYGYDDFKKYENLINYKKITNIKFNKFTKNIYQKIKKFDLLCHLSKREGMPVSIIEALCLGVPVIGYKIRGNTDLIKHGYNGFLIEPYNLQLFIKVILNIINGKVNFKLIKKNCQKYNNKKHDQNSINKKLIHFINYACRHHI